ncbi:MAG: hypothetical protein C4K60_06280 [Ideonella sp. MAG2]|nr:MAG: hypothetical protein C4K60_06280 [Ideonella sp. MAG2]
MEDTAAVGGTVSQAILAGRNAFADNPAPSSAQTPVLSEGEAGAAPVAGSTRPSQPTSESVTATADATATVGTTTTTVDATTSVGTGATAETTAEAKAAHQALDAAPAATVVQLRPASPQSVGLVTVALGCSPQSNGFMAKLPDPIAKALRTRAAVSAKLAEGQPLPTWLQFDRQAMAFSSPHLPPGALPLLVTLRSGKTTAVVKLDCVGVQ